MRVRVCEGGMGGGTAAAWLWMRRGGGTGQRRFDLVGEFAVGFELLGELLGVDAYAAPDEAEQRLH